MLEAALSWYISGSALPVNKEDLLTRDPVWDADVRRARYLLQFQLDGIDKE